MGGLFWPDRLYLYADQEIRYNRGLIRNLKSAIRNGIGRLFGGWYFQ